MEGGPKFDDWERAGTGLSGLRRSGAAALVRCDDPKHRC